MSTSAPTMPRPDSLRVGVRPGQPAARTRHRTLRLGRLSGLLGALLGLLVVDIVLNGPLRHLDGAIAAAPWHRFDGEGRSAVLAGWLAFGGQRAYSAPVLVAVAGYLAWRFSSRRPLVLAGGSLFALNAAVGAAKIFFGRSRPRSGMDLLWTNGVQFPSGHTANAVLTWGLTVYLIAVYLRPPVAVTRRLAAGVAALSAGVSAASLYLNTHWLSDLVSGLLAGGLLLTAVVALDRATAPARGGEPPRPEDREVAAIEQVATDAGAVGAGAPGVGLTDAAARSRIPV